MSFPGLALPAEAVPAKENAARPALTKDVAERVKIFDCDVAGGVQAGVVHMLSDDAPAEEIVVGDRQAGIWHAMWRK